MNTRYRYLPLVIIAVFLALFLSAGPAPVKSRAADQGEAGDDESVSFSAHPSASTDNMYHDDVHRPSGEDPPKRFEAALDVIPRIENGRLYFDITTNLPDGMAFLVTIVDDMGMVNSAETTLERVHTVIDGGGMVVGPFPSRDMPFPSGEYTFYLDSLPADQQPREVLSITGATGENLSGRYVTRGRILVVKTFMVTGAARSR